MKRVNYILGILPVVVLLWSCTSRSEGRILNSIHGVWICTEIDDKKIETNDILVRSFIPKTVQIHAEGYTTESNAEWKEKASTYVVEGDLIKIKGSGGFDAEWNTDIKVKSIDSKKLEYTVASAFVDGQPQEVNELYTMRKAKDNYKSNILGFWRGKETTHGASPEEKIWEYRDNNEYVYYRFVESKWTVQDDNDGEYFLYGDVLAINWTSVDTTGIADITKRHFECWEIDISEGTMRWEATRAKNVRKSFSMVKLEKLP